MVSGMPSSESFMMFGCLGLTPGASSLLPAPGYPVRGSDPATRDCFSTRCSFTKAYL